MDETALIQAARQGDLDAFNRLVLAYQDMAFHLAARMLSDTDLAEDVTQTAFLSAYRNFNTFRGGSFKAWVMRMVTNACYDQLRLRQRRPTTPLEPVDDDDEAVESPAWMADGTPTPEEQLEQAELESAIQRCLGGLDADFRAVVVMVDLQGMDYHEVSGAIQKPLGTVKSRLARARLKLRDCLHRFWELLPSTFRLDHQRNL
jgi:RNA polymerase sigma-70 factor (ECF subfamily)